MPGAANPAQLIAMQRSARISGCGRYRYELTRRWDEARPECVFVMLNPSSADASVDDPTIRRCTGLARSWGFGALRVVNRMALRTSDPRELGRDPDPIGPENERWLRRAADADLIVCAWGASVPAGRLPPLPAALLRQPLWCLGLTRDGQPRHPLYVRRDVRPRRWPEPTTRAVPS